MLSIALPEPLGPCVPTHMGTGGYFPGGYSPSLGVFKRRGIEGSRLVVGLSHCSGNAESQPGAVMEHLVGRQGQPKVAQLHAIYLSDWKG